MSTFVRERTNRKPSSIDRNPAARGGPCGGTGGSRHSA